MSRSSRFRRAADRSFDPNTETRPVSSPPNGRWETIEQFELHGYRYKLIRRPIELEPSGSRLTRREKQVIECALQGASNKSIAAGLGLAPSTIGVLIFRAAAKLRVKSRQELLDTYTRMVRDGDV